MLRNIRTALIGLLSVVVLASMLGGTPRAEANPRTPLPDGQSRYPTVTLSTTQWTAAKLVTQAGRKAVSESGKTLYYKKAKRVFAANKKYGTDWRRQMAAGFRQAGGRISGISKAENKKVEALRKKLYGKRKPAADSISGRRRLPDGPDCKGKSGKVVVNKNESHTYFNSCETQDILIAWGACIAGMGAIVKRIGPKVKQAVLPAELVGLFCTLQAGAVLRAQSNSDEKAIYVKAYQAQTYIPYPGGLRYYITYTVESQ